MRLAVQEERMSSRSLVLRRAAGVGVAVAVLVGLHAAAQPLTPAAPAPPHIGIFDAVHCADDWCAPMPSPTPTAVPFASRVTRSSTVPSNQAVALDPTSADVYPSERFAFVLDNRSSVSVQISDAAGVVVATIGVGQSATLRAPGAGTYRYTVTSPPSDAPPVLTIVAHEAG